MNNNNGKDVVDNLAHFKDKNKGMAEECSTPLTPIPKEELIEKYLGEIDAERKKVMDGLDQIATNIINTAQSFSELRQHCRGYFDRCMEISVKQVQAHPEFLAEILERTLILHGKCLGQVNAKGISHVKKMHALDQKQCEESDKFKANAHATRGNTIITP